MFGSMATRSPGEREVTEGCTARIEPEDSWPRMCGERTTIGPGERGSGSARDEEGGKDGRTVGRKERRKVGEEGRTDGAGVPEVDVGAGGGKKDIELAGQLDMRKGEGAGRGDCRG